MPRAMGAAQCRPGHRQPDTCDRLEGRERLVVGVLLVEAQRHGAVLGRSVGSLYQNKFDTTIMMNVLEHCISAFEVLESLYNVTKPAAASSSFGNQPTRPTGTGAAMQGRSFC